MTDGVTIPTAFIGGLLSFASPCVLPLVPSYISFVTGISFEELTDSEGDLKRIKGVILLNSLMFVLGFSTVFIAVLGASAQLFGSLFFEYQDIIRKFAGVVIVILGVHITGIININILHREKKLHFFRDKPAGFFGSFLVGVGFAAGWTPCIGPILAMIFTVAATSTNPWAGTMLFVAYSMGLAIPFLLTSLGINTFLKYFQRYKKHMRAVSITTGLLLIVTGILIFFNSFAIITQYFYTIMPNLG
ncbi:MAG: sulfite exporter TauE/SafE family protein [Deltaproteobacteria bacterium]|nr:sulfite exporter TauE/SafE family protein [Deltaproteobacteria bacterium]